MTRHGTGDLYTGSIPSILGAVSIASREKWSAGFARPLPGSRHRRSADTMPWRTGHCIQDAEKKISVHRLAACKTHISLWPDGFNGTGCKVCRCWYHVWSNDGRKYINRSRNAEPRYCISHHFHHVGSSSCRAVGLAFGLRTG